MTQEQKAKAYDVLVNKAESMYKMVCETNYENTRMALENLFPQLAESESEDERIRKKLIRFIESPCAKEHLLQQDEKEFLSWLEKQKDLFEPYDWNEYKDKPVEVWNAYIRGKAVGIEISRKQKPAEWSEEDRTKLAHISRCIRKYAADGIQADNLIYYITDLIRRAGYHWKPSEEQMTASSPLSHRRNF